MMLKRLLGIGMAAMALSPAFLEGCSSKDNPLCCTEFTVGATINADIGGSVQSQVAVQALADISGIASASIDDITTACRGMAQDLDVAQADQDTAEANTDANAKMKAWCGLAVTAIGTARASASITINVAPPVCEASVSAKLDCQAKCSGGVKCDIKANPPTCTGGKLTVSCKGDCTASAGASVSCTGTCSGSCSGSCTAQGGVECNGKCDGTCSASGAGGTGTGIQADGTCNGTCKGTCAVTAPSATCTGSCSGSCSATCKGSATASVKCDGTCAGDYEPISCSGGTLSGGCQADAKCDANCDGSVQAKASCTPPSVDIAITGNVDANIGAKLLATLKANLPIIYSIQARFTALGSATGSLTANIGAVVDIKAACIPPVVAAAAQAVVDIGDAVSATGSIVAKLK